MGEVPLYGTQKTVRLAAILPLGLDHLLTARFRDGAPFPGICAPRGTSLIRNTPPVGPYSSPMPRDLW